MMLSKRILIIGMAMLFLVTSVIPLTESLSFSADPPVSVGITGTWGENGWFVSGVTIIFIINSEEVDYIMFMLDEGEWTIYTAPLVIDDDGIHTFCWYYVDTEGNHSEIECIDVKIDQIPPVIELTIERIGFRKYLAKANVSDGTSGINKVEFYFDYILIVNVTEEPYEYEFSAMSMAHDVCAIVYDDAGNQEITPLHSPPPPTRVFGIIRNPEFTEDTVSFFAIAVVCSSCLPCFHRQIMFYTVFSTYDGYIGNYFICAVFPYGPWLL